MRTAFRLFAVTVGLLLWVHAPASAQTPPTTFDTTLPAVTGSTFPVNAGGSIQTAINAAAVANPNLNHEIVVQAGSAFTGALTIPARAAGTGWIIIRSSALASLPAAGTRVGPANATNMPKIQGPGTGASFTPIIDILAGARQWRLVGLEVTISNGSPHATLIRIGSGAETTVGQLATNIVLDRVYLHSFSTALSAGLKFGVQMNGAKIALLDSYVDDMKAAPNQILSGDDGESKGVIAWNGSGPFKIVNNFIQAAAINVLFGGSDASAAALRPADLDFRNNYVPKDAARWRGTSVVAKTTFELKNMARVLIEGNRFETAWVPANGDGGQLIRLNVRNQNGTDPGSRVQDITFRNNIVKSGGTGIQFLVHDDPNASSNMARGLFENNLFDDINSVTWGGLGNAWTFASYSPGSPEPNSAQEMVFNHNTVFSNMAPINAQDSTNQVFEPGANTFQNNIFQRGSFGLVSGSFGEGTPTLNGRFAAAPFTRNLMIGGSSLSYPANNFFPVTVLAVGFVNFAAGDYHLAATSIYRNLATDGTDIGVNVDTLNARQACTISGVCSPAAAPAAPFGLTLSFSWQE
ncbi:MAG: hypothetical protein DMD96_12800 [Candidatus Rokuibacteriota bacterium]|nr:MAG: hypothetical protein DMD96_12800 [Candidatus Rokubacteria bacterium]